MRFDTDILQDQRQILTQTQLQSLHILEMNNYEMYEFLNNEMMENPLLDIEDQSGIPDAVPLTERTLSDWTEESRWLLGGDYTDYTYCSGNSGSGSAFDIPDDSYYGMDTVVHLQLKGLSRTEYAVVDILTGYMDENGFLDVDKEEFIKKYGCPETLFEHCVKLIQSLEPAGIGARDYRECLLLQLERKGMATPQLRALINDHLTDAAAGRYTKIAKAMKLTAETVKKLMEQLKGLRTKPVYTCAKERTEYIIPDVIFKYDGSRFKISLHDGWIGSLNINGLYKGMVKEVHTKEEQEYLIKKIERARTTIKMVEQRRSTILNICEYIAENQKEFLLGKDERRALTMKETAGRLGYHESTISRAIKNKYLQCPCGTFAIRSFFSTASYRSESTDASREAIKKWIVKIVSDEDKRRPCSDEEIVRRLHDKKIDIARRTVAKYREELMIPGTSVRKCV